MRRRIFKATRARGIVLALGMGALGSLAMAPATLAAAPAAGVNCQAQDGKISGRGSTLQIWLQYDLMGAYASDVCGPVPADTNANGAQDVAGAPVTTGAQFDFTDPGSAIFNLPNANTYGQNWLTAYDYNSAQAIGSAGNSAAIGSGAGETAIGCKAEAFAGTDIPVTAAQLTAINSQTIAAVANNGYSAPGNNGKQCVPNNASGNPPSSFLVSPFAPQPQPAGFPTPGQYPNPGDTAAPSELKGVMTFPIGVSAVAQFINVPTSCLVNPANPPVLSTTDMANIWGGTYLTWNAVGTADANSNIVATGCNATVAVNGNTIGQPLLITRVVRNDNSGTTQSFDNYLSDSNGYSAPGNTTGICSGNANTNAANWNLLQSNQANAAVKTDVEWPGTGTTANGGIGPASATCSGIIKTPTAGGPALITEVEITEGGIGYADYSDTLHDSLGFTSQITGDTVVDADLQSSTGASGTGVAPFTGKASNCSVNAAKVPGGVGIVGLGSSSNPWALSTETSPNSIDADVAYGGEGSAYPICSLTWDFAYSGEDGNTPSAPTTGAAVTAGAGAIQVSSLAGLPNSGSFTAPTGGTGSTTTNTGSSVTLPVTSLLLTSTAGMPYSGQITIPVGFGTTNVQDATIGTATAIQVASISGAPNAGTITVADSAGNEVLNYTGVSAVLSTCTAAGVAATPCITGLTGGTSGADLPPGAAVTFPSSVVNYAGITGNLITGVTNEATGEVIPNATAVGFPNSETISYTGLSTAPVSVTGVTGDTLGVANGASLQFPLGTGGPEADLTADQRRTLYAYFTYVESPAAQATEAAAGYDALPATWVSNVRSQFVTAF